jgi:hypothetical protein
MSAILLRTVENSPGFSTDKVTLLRDVWLSRTDSCGVDLFGAQQLNGRS